MTTWPRQLTYRRLRAPREDRVVLIDPPWDEADALVDRNVQLREQNDYDFQGRSLKEISTQGRRELLQQARRWTSAYRDLPSAGSEPHDLIFLAGHQPQLFHPGVWLKNFALGALAGRHGAAAVNLIIDSDNVKSTDLRVPGGTVDRPQVEMIPFDRTEPAIPYEERQIVDRELFAAFGRRATERIRSLVPDPLLQPFWPLVLQRLQQHGNSLPGNLGACVAQARHQWEGQWGLQTLEVPQSWVCATQSFCWFVAHLLDQLPRLREVYNEAVEEYRGMHRIRNQAQPVTKLSTDGDWLEAPLWIWTAQSPQRRALFARRRGGQVLLSDRDALEFALPLRSDGDASAAVGRLMELGRQGIKIRSKALVTTLWARLALGDLFLHGIGGAKYDQVTDLVFARFFGLSPPGLMVVSATLQLPVARRRVTVEDARTLRRQLRELQYHPEQCVDSSNVAAPEGGDDPSQLIGEKARWIQTPLTVEDARTRCRAIRRINEALQPWVADRRRRLLQFEAQTRQALQAEAVLAWREYAFCLYPEGTLREFVEGLLCKNR